MRWWDHGSSTLMDEFNALITRLSSAALLPCEAFLPPPEDAGTPLGDGDLAFTRYQSCP